MLDELQFRRVAEAALDALMQHLIVREEEVEAGFEVDQQGGALTVDFEEPAGKFVITPNAPMGQIWISALSSSFKLDWDEAASAFILPSTGEDLMALVDRLIGEQLKS
jgi:CyaY protein